ncbi:MAG: hypothetical protein JXA82_12905 [Sedimentisphaerales bacterium]|nr:hypothetical protein [Sedimentisphaerales bacterium]
MRIGKVRALFLTAIQLLWIEKGRRRYACGPSLVNTIYCLAWVGGNAMFPNSGGGEGGELLIRVC